VLVTPSRWAACNCPRTISMSTFSCNNWRFSTSRSCRSRSIRSFIRWGGTNFYVSGQISQMVRDAHCKGSEFQALHAGPTLPWSLRAGSGQSQHPQEDALEESQRHASCPTAITNIIMLGSSALDPGSDKRPPTFSAL
jgi:hypothetical protein